MKRRSLLTSYLLWLFFGVLGIHRFYLGHTVWGVVYLLTGGLFLIGVIVDLFLMPSYVRDWNRSV